MARIMVRVTSAPAVRRFLAAMKRAGGIFGRAGRFLGRALSWALVTLIGRWQWRPAGWMSFTTAQTKRGWIRVSRHTICTRKIQDSIHLLNSKIR